MDSHNGGLKNRFRPGSTSDTLSPNLPSSMRKHIKHPHNHQHALSQQQQQQQQHHPRYILPCFRIRSTKSALLIIFAICALSLSIMTAILGTMSLSNMNLNSNPSGVHFLPTAKEWGEGREERRKERRRQQELRDQLQNDGGSSSRSVGGGAVDGSRSSGNNIYPSLYGGGGGSSVLKQVETLEYENAVLDFITRIGQQSQTVAVSLQSPQPLGANLQNFAQLGCSIYNNRNSNYGDVRNSTFSIDNMQQLWSSHLSPILQASKHTDDLNYSHKNWTKTLLKSLSPDALIANIHTKSILGRKNKPMKTQDIERIIAILTRRLLGLLQHLTTMKSNTQTIINLESIAPPLRIAVFGGPTVEGMGCRNARVEIPHGSIMANPSFCSFPYRLEQFLNGMLLPPNVLQRLAETLGVPPSAIASNGMLSSGYRMVEVLNLGEEGTNSEYSTSIVRNRMYPPLGGGKGGGMPGIGGLSYGGGPPDVIIHAYGIDDYGKETRENNINSFYHAVREKEEDVSKRGCLKENRKPPPVVIRAVMEENDLVNTKASSASVLTAVLGDTVDDAEYAEELAFPNLNDKKLVERGVLRMAGHLATSWVLAFDLGYAAMNHCAGIAGNNLPAPMQNNIANNPQNSMCDNGIDPPCIFSFLAGPKGTVTRPSAIASTLMPYVVENSGWQPESDMTAGFARKTGLVGSGDGATLTLLFQNITRPVRRFDVVTLRSTSPLWKDGLAKFTIVTGGDFSHGSKSAESSFQSARETSFEISAELIAGRSTGGDQHISYHFGLDLVEGQNSGALGTDVLVRISLTKGSKFKILGLMLCE